MRAAVGFCHEIVLLLSLGSDNLSIVQKCVLKFPPRVSGTN